MIIIGFYSAFQKIMIMGYTKHIFKLKSLYYYSCSY